MNSDKGKELLGHSPDQTELWFKDGAKKVFTDKNGKPIVAGNYLKRLEKQTQEKQRLEENLHWESFSHDLRNSDRKEPF
jgi:hypothetical protein